MWGFGKHSGPTGPPEQTPFANFPRPSSPLPPATPPFPSSSAPLPSASPRTFDASEREWRPSSFDNAHLATRPPHPSVAPSRQSSFAGDVGSPGQTRSSPSYPHGNGASIYTKVSRFQNSERTRSPPIQYTEDFLKNPDTDVTERSSLSPPKSWSGPGVLGTPGFQYNKRSSTSADGMNSDTNVTKLVSHSVTKRTRSPPPPAGHVIQMNSYSTDDDTERELQAKAKRLARFKTELQHEVEPSDSIQHGSNVTKKRISSWKTNHSAIEKQKLSEDYPSGSMEDMSQDFDNEDLQSCSIIVGLCLDMCPESERAERERKGDLDRYERLDGDRNQTSKTLAVKKYNRTAEREAELIRPMPILQKTMDYLLGLLDQPYDDRFLGLYNFLWDRMRAIRMDLRMQHIFNLGAITMLEKMIRLHIIAMHELCEFSKGEGFSEGFDAHLNIEQMNKTSVELFQIYDDHRKRGIFIPTEKEFRGYYALLKLDKHPGYKVEPAELSLDLAKMTAEIRQTQEVLFARDVARSCRTGNFIAFFRHARKASYLQACLMHAHFSKLRTQALASLHSGLQYNQGLPMAHLAKWLGMEGEDIESLLEYHGFSIKEFEEPYMVKEGPFLNDGKDYPTRCSRLVHIKKSETIVEDVISPHQVIPLPLESKKELESDKNKKNKHAVVQAIETKSTPIVSDGVKDIEANSSPRGRMQVQPVLETSRSLHVQPELESSTGSQPGMVNHQRASPVSPKSNIKVAKAFPRFESHGIQEKPSPLATKDGSFIIDDGQLSNKSYPPWNFSTPQFIPDAQPTYLGLEREGTFHGLVRSSPETVKHSELKTRQSDDVSTNAEKWIPPASEVDSGVAKSLRDDMFMEELPLNNFTEMQRTVESNDVASYYDEEVAEAKLKLLLRLWRRRSARKREFREQNRLAANAALSSLSLGPPIRQKKDKSTPCKKLNIDQAVNERFEKRQESWARWNVSDLVAGILSDKNKNSICISWKIISFSWLHSGSGDIEARNQPSRNTLDKWLHYKLIAAEKDETVSDLVMPAPGLSIWRKWVPNDSGDISCCFSVIKDIESGNFQKKLVGANAILFPTSETVPWELQKIHLHNLVMSLPVGACIPLLILSGSGEDNLIEFSGDIIDKLGLKDIDKSRIGSLLVICPIEKEETGQLDGYFSDQKLREGLMWLASESRPQPVLYHVTLRELVSSYLKLCLDVLDPMGSDKLSPNQCISAFNEALDQSINDVVSAANMNPTGWPCAELFLLDNSTAEFRAVQQFLPSLGWSSSEEVEPLISALKSCKLPSFSHDMSWLSKCCSTSKDIEDQRQLIQDCLIRYLTESNVMNSMMAPKEASVMLQKCTRLELHDTEYKVVPNWVMIFRRVFNWRLNMLASIKGYVLEQSSPKYSSTFLEKLEFEANTPHCIVNPSLDEMVEVGFSPIASKRVRSSPRNFQNMEAITSIRDTVGVTISSYPVEDINRGSRIAVQPGDDYDVYVARNDLVVVPKAEKEADRLTKLLDRCNMLQDDIDKKLSVYF